jgi:FkbM family methyltransferase
MRTARTLARKAGVGRLRRALVPALEGLARDLDARRPPLLRTIRYRGFEVVYSRGTSLIERIRGGGDYEPELVEAVVARLRDAPQPALVDVGANIGLVSLGVLATVPSVRIHAFEPGSHAAMLLRRTIARNGLEERLTLTEAAVSDEDGAASFATHATRHASGDGLRDTGRAGEVVTTSVRTVRLDTWWADAGRPHVDVLKVDVEGAERLVFAGARELLGAERPTIFFELHPANLAPYPYEAADVLAQLADLGYGVRTIVGGEPVVAASVEDVIQRRTDMVAEPSP